MAALSGQRLVAKRILVTAAGGGIGRAIAGRLVAEGAVVAGCDVDAGAVAALGRDLPGVVPFEADVSDEASVAAMCGALAADARFGGLDGLVNTAGVAGEAGRVEDLDVVRWAALFSVNVGGPFTCIKHCVPLLGASGGSVVNVSSTGGGHSGYPFRSPYASSKAALTGLTQTLAMELGRSNVRVNTISPGLIAGDRCDAVVALTAEASGESEAVVRAKWQAQNMMRAFLDADDVAAAAAFLLSDDARFITAQNLCVDAGTTSLDNLDDFDLVPKAAPAALGRS